MNIEFRKSFEKDLIEILDPNLLPRIQEVIERVEQVEKLSEVSNLKKLKGEADYYRIRVGDYRKTSRKPLPLGMGMNAGAVLTAVRF